MRDRIDPLIEDRAPWLFSGRPGTAQLRRALDRLLGYETCVALATALEQEDAQRIMAILSHRIARRVSAEGLHHIPETGPALVLANHPTGIADGIILHHLIAPQRPDLFFFANNDILRVLPQMADLIAPVEWRLERRSRDKTRETLDYTRRAVDKGRLGVIFPSGRLMQRRGLRLHERDWMTSAAALARRFDLPVIPLHISARNSALFYLFDLIHPSLRDITLFHEVLNKDRQRFHVRMGRPIPPGALPRGAEAATAFLRAQVLGLGSGAPDQGLREAGRATGRKDRPSAVQ